MMRNLVALAALAASAVGVPVTQSFWSSTSSWSPIGAEANGTMAIQALIERRLPLEFQFIFDLHIDTSLGNSSQFDTFEITTLQPSRQIQINASSTSGLARGLYTYLRTRGGEISFTTNTYTSAMLQASLDTSTSWSGSSWVPWRYLFNVVQYSYYTVFADWPQWEYLLDWAALSGVNLPLAIGGQEMIWAEVYRDFGMTDDEIVDYFTPAAFYSWQRMGNIRGSWGRTASYEFLGKQWKLQQQIISRMLALGMTPILPAFNGFIPETLHKYIGGQDPMQASEWNAFPPQYTQDYALDPTWDSFKTVQSAFLKKQSDMYGGWTSHYYSIDLYNELTPPSTSSDYLKSVTSNVVQSLKNEDSEATWVMQGWMFANDKKTWNNDTIAGFLSGAGDDDMMVLDLAAEAWPMWNETNSFGGKKWVWNLLMNYGGNEGMYGSLWHYTSEVIRAKQNSQSLTGIGLAPEAFDNNELVWQLMLDTAWSTETIDPIDWVKKFVTRRYGMGLPGFGNGTNFIMQAWEQILPVAYNNTDPDIKGVPKSIVELVPDITGLLNRTGGQPTKLPYANPDLVTSCNNLLAAAFNAPKMIEIPSYQYDMVVCTRQVLLNTAETIYIKMLDEWQKTTNATGMSELGDLLLDIMQDNDRVMAVNSNMLLSTWIGNARKWSDDPDEQDWLEYQARNQITVWGPIPTDNGSWPLNRYATKQWSGLIGGFYRNSWMVLVNYLKQTPPNKYNETYVNEQIRSYEIEWCDQKWGQRSNETWTTSGEDLLSLIAMLRPKWGDWFTQNPWVS